MIIEQQPEVFESKELCQLPLEPDHQCLVCLEFDYTADHIDSLSAFMRLLPGVPNGDVLLKANLQLHA